MTFSRVRRSGSHIKLKNQKHISVFCMCQKHQNVTFCTKIALCVLPCIYKNTYVTYTWYYKYTKNTKNMVISAKNPKIGQNRVFHGPAGQGPRRTTLRSLPYFYRNLLTDLYGFDRKSRKWQKVVILDPFLGYPTFPKMAIFDLFMKGGTVICY